MRFKMLGKSKMLYFLLNVSYGVFAATKLVGLRSSTIFCMIALEILLQHNMAYQIVKMHKKVSSDGNEKFDLKKFAF